MENILGGFAFFALIAGQVATVIAVHRMRRDEAAPHTSQPEIRTDARTRHAWLSAA